MLEEEQSSFEGSRVQRCLGGRRAYRLMEEMKSWRDEAAIGEALEWMKAQALASHQW